MFVVRCEPRKMKNLRCKPTPQLIPPWCVESCKLLNLALDCFQQTIVTQEFQKWYNPNHNKKLHEVLSQITEDSKTRHMRFPIVQNWTTVRSTAGSCMRRLWDVVQLLNPTNWKTSRGLIPVIVQAQRLKALPFSDILRLHVLPLCPNMCTWRETVTRHWSCLWSVVESLKLENKSGPRLSPCAISHSWYLSILGRHHTI